MGEIIRFQDFQKKSQPSESLESTNDESSDKLDKGSERHQQGDVVDFQKELAVQTLKNEWDRVSKDISEDSMGKTILAMALRTGSTESDIFIKKVRILTQYISQVNRSSTFYKDSRAQAYKLSNEELLAQLSNSNENEWKSHPTWYAAILEVLKLNPSKFI